jgi:hypothetical protein
MIEYTDDPVGRLRRATAEYQRAQLFAACRPVASGCWEWLGYGTADNRPRIKIGRVSHVAARASYLIFVGKIPRGKVICHTCDNPLCVNPAHLKPGTHKENLWDATLKARVRGRYKLDAEKVASIKALLAQGSKQSALATSFGVSFQTISAIAAGRTWSDVAAASINTSQSQGEAK